MTQFPLWLGLLIVAPAIGSFLGAAITRKTLPIRGSSRCDCCDHLLAWNDLLPIVSWIQLGRRCRYCGSKLNVFYPLVEIAACIPVLAAASMTSGWRLLVGTLLGWILIVLGWIDWRTYRLPDGLTATVFVGGLIAAYIFDRPRFIGDLLGAVLGFLLLAVIAWSYRSLRGREGLGMGDAKLLGGLGAWVSWAGLPATLFIGALSGLVYVLGRSVNGKPLRVDEHLPFGPFLAFAGWVVWLYRPVIGF